MSATVSEHDCEGYNTWEDVESAITKHHHNADLEAARILYSSVAAHFLEGPPVWPMVVAPPGSMKTELLNGMDGMSKVHFIDSLTPQTFISGQIDEAPDESKPSASLLNRIGNDGVIVYPDFSTVLAMKRDNKAAILADMRRIYDGQLSKEFGTSQNLKQRDWRGRITFVVAVTPAIDGCYSVFQTLGERFVMVRWPRAGGIEAALSAMNQDTKEAKADLKAAVHGLLTHLKKLKPEITAHCQTRIAAMTEIAVRGRTHVPRSGYNKDIVYVPEAESSTRMAQQLAQLAKGSALLDGRSRVNERDLALVKRVAFDSMPPTRKQVLECLLAGQDPKLLKIPKSTLSYALEELEAQELIDREPSRLSKLVLEMAHLAGFLEVPEERELDLVA
jgi:hypothetical protein